MPPSSQSRVAAQRRTAPSKSIAQLRDEQQKALEAADEVAGKIKDDYSDWFKTLLPSHVPVEAFVTLLYGVLRRDAKLTYAARINMQSFLIAATECAQLGATPGKDYHFLTFTDKETSWPTVTGVTDYKLEIKLALQSPEVETVEVECVYKGDDFDWQPGMRIPHHVIKDKKRHHQDLYAVYAYCTDRDGRRIGKCIVMWRDEVMLHKAKARSKALWEDPLVEPYMWMKTPVHVGRRFWPQSPEKETAQAVAMAKAMQLGGTMAQLAPDEAPVLVPPARGQVTDGRPRPDGTPPGDALRTVTGEHDTGHGPGDREDDPSWAGMGATSKDRPGNGNGNGNGNGHPVIEGKAEPVGHGPGEPEPDLDAPVTSPTMGQLNRMFQVVGWSGKPAEAAGITRDHRRIVACLLASRNATWPYRSVATVSDMTEREVRHALGQASDMRKTAGGDGEALAAQFKRIYDAAMQAKGRNGGNGGNGGGGEAGA